MLFPGMIPKRRERRAGEATWASQPDYLERGSVPRDSAADVPRNHECCLAESVTRAICRW